MCCGKRSSGAAPRGGSRGVGGAPGTRGLDPLPGASGMVLLEYMGSNAGTETWTNAHEGTGQVYAFGGSRRIGYVDKRDAEWMLKVRANGRNVFRISTPQAPTPRAFVAPQVTITKTVAPQVQAVTPKPALTPVIEASAPEPAMPPHDEDFGEAPAPETPAPTAVVIDLLGLSVRDLKVMLEENTYPRDVLESTLKQEKRATARKLLEAALA